MNSVSPFQSKAKPSDHGTVFSQNSCSGCAKRFMPTVNLPDATLLLYQGFGPAVTTTGAVVHAHYYSSKSPKHLNQIH